MIQAQFYIFFSVAIFIFMLSGVTGLTIVNPYGPVPRRCMDCICDTVSECSNENVCVEGDACGAYRITPTFWRDAGRLTVNGESPDSQDAFVNCVMDRNCSWTTVQNFMTQNKKDCNGDGKVDCKDYFALHILGADCNQTLHENFLNRYEQCDEPEKVVSSIPKNNNFFLPNYDEVCSKCICHAASGCNKTIECDNEFCGTFRISKYYWTAAGRPVLLGDDPDRRTAFEDCVLDDECAERTVRQYFRAFGKDCNGDQVTSCLDYIMLHYNTGTDCSQPVDQQWIQRYHECLVNNIPDIKDEI